MTEEVWKPVVGYEMWYEVSNQGRVRRSVTITNTWAGRILHPRIHPVGYVAVFLCVANMTRTMTVHKLVVEAFIGPILEGMQVNHKNGKKGDNRLENLEIVTPAENIHHALVVLGAVFSHSGEDHWCHKLTESDVREIRRICAAGGVSTSQIGKQYGVKQNTIEQIISRKRWAHVED